MSPFFWASLSLAPCPPPPASRYGMKPVPDSALETPKSRAKPRGGKKARDPTLLSEDYVKRWGWRLVSCLCLGILQQHTWYTRWNIVFWRVIWSTVCVNLSSPIFTDTYWQSGIDMWYVHLLVSLYDILHVIADTSISLSSPLVSSVFLPAYNDDICRRCTTPVRDTRYRLPGRRCVPCLAVA